MKIRSDFVTNSSSSSFIVNLEMSFADGFSLALEGNAFYGDDEGLEYNLRGTDAEGEVLCECETAVYGEEFFDLGKVNALSMVKIADTNSVEALKRAIAKTLRYDMSFTEESLSYDSDPECIEDEDFDEHIEEDEDFDEDEAAIDISAVEDELSAHLEDVSDMTKIALRIEMGGFGEGTPGPEEMLGYLFGDACIDDIFRGDDEEEMKEQLRELRMFKRFDEESLDALIAVMTDENARAVTAEIVLDEDRNIHMDFFEEEA